MKTTTTYIINTVQELSALRYPNDAHSQLLYQIGFLAESLSKTWDRDTIHLSEFRLCVDHNKGPAAR
jgi:hypothetical protein